MYVYVCMYVVICMDFIGPPGVRVNSVKNVEDLSTVIQWDAVNNPLPTTYTVTWTDDRNLHGVDTVDEQTSYTITGLTLDTVYTVTVTPANTCGDGTEGKTRVSFPTGTTFTIIIYHFVLRRQVHWYLYLSVLKYMF